MNEIEVLKMLQSKLTLLPAASLLFGSGGRGRAGKGGWPGGQAAFLIENKANSAQLC